MKEGIFENNVYKGPALEQGSEEGQSEELARQARPLVLEEVAEDN